MMKNLFQKKVRKMKYRVKFDAFVEIENNDDVDDVYDIVESRLRGALNPLEHKDGIIAIDTYNYVAEELE